MPPLFYKSTPRFCGAFILGIIMDQNQDLFSENFYYNPQSIKDLSSRMFYEDYLTYFDHKTAILSTNYKPLQTITIKFNIDQLVHLLGLQKVIHQNDKQILKSMKSGYLDFKSLTSKPNFKDIKDRLYNYHFLHEVFYDTLITTVISTVNLKPNMQKLDALFLKVKTTNNKVAILGIRNIGNNIYVPVTLHTVRYNKYNTLKKANIITKIIK